MSHADYDNLSSLPNWKSIKASYEVYARRIDKAYKEIKEARNKILELFSHPLKKRYFRSRSGEVYVIKEIIMKDGELFFESHLLDCNGNETTSYRGFYAKNIELLPYKQGSPTVTKKYNYFLRMDGDGLIQLGSVDEPLARYLAQEVSEYGDKVDVSIHIFNSCVYDEILLKPVFSDISSTYNYVGKVYADYGEFRIKDIDVDIMPILKKHVGKYMGMKITYSR